MNVVLMEVVNHPFWVGIVLVEDRLAHGVPPEPVLHNIIEGNMEIAVLVCNIQNFFLRIIPVLALPVTIGPFAKERRRAGQLTISGYNLVEIRAVNKKIIHRVRYFRAEIEGVDKAIIQPAS